MVLRQRRKIRTLDKIVKELDAFPKVPETYVEKTASGAAISIITTILVIVLLCSETSYFMDPGINFRFIPDTDFKSKLEINVDITIATPCKAIGADEEDTWFDLDRVQRPTLEAIRTFNKYLREEYHAIQNLLWKSGSLSLYGELPPRRVIPDEPHDACRIHGSLTLNKVAGHMFTLQLLEEMKSIILHIALIAFLLENPAWRYCSASRRRRKDSYARFNALPISNTSRAYGHSRLYRSHMVNLSILCQRAQKSKLKKGVLETHPEYISNMICQH
ncbi:ERGIC2 [Lepeophtheirus salmonis]|uniref:ERGIC2 n=1 Tax=Lepeophtheirus salmonis TaxID=72036 RepID=A0A7R8CRS8_LEPSM|nr:ERGIC2 [Lepeophtheirus salmonis]CAF2859123.1 ERGIC2 [Lepeophtheirus salmonis]